MKKKTILRLGIEGAVVAACPPLGILVGLNETVNLTRWAKKRKGQWTEDDEKKSLALKMMAGNPVAAVDLLGKAAFKDNPPEIYKAVSKSIACGFGFMGDVDTILDIDSLTD